MCQNPSKKKKEELPQWMFIDLIDPMKIRRNYLNYKDCHALIIEFDNKEGKYISIDAFAEKYKHLTWILHTTSSHTKALHKFRVILPLDVPTAYSTWHHAHVRAEMQVYFEGIDPSSFSNFQKIPSLPANPSEYEYRVNKGVKFSFSMIRDGVNSRDEMEKKIALERAKERSTRKLDDSINYQAYKAKVIENLTREFGGCGRVETGHRYTDLVKYCTKMINARYPDNQYIFEDHEVMGTILGECHDQAVSKMVRTFLRKRC